MRNAGSSIQKTPSGTVFSRFVGIACRTVFLGLIVTLTACTGSSEQPVSGIELVVAINPNPAPQQVSCGNQSPDTISATGPGLLVLDTVKLSGQGSDAQQRCTFLALEAAPYSVLTGTRVPQGARFIVSLPTVGKVQDWPSSLTGTAAAPTSPTELVRPTNAPDFCPTKIAISPIGDLAAALDDPGVTDSGCATTNRAPRVVVWRRFTAPGQPLQPTVAFPYAVNGGPIAIALSDTTLFVLSPLAGQYRLTRYTLSTSNTPPTLDLEAASQALAPITLSSTPKQANLLLNGSNLYIAYGDDFSGKVYQVASNATALPGDEFKVNNQVLGIVLNQFSDGKVQDGTNQPTFAFTLQNTLKFSRGDVISSQSASVRTVTFTPDGFAWTLGTGGNLTQYDLISLSNLTPTANAFLNSSLNARDLAWIQRPF
jgi:hypothetical protein